MLTDDIIGRGYKYARGGSITFTVKSYNDTHVRFVCGHTVEIEAFMDMVDASTGRPNYSRAS
jgi:hypothetical protein